MDFWDDAIKGSSALRAGLYRRLIDECTCALGLDTAAIYWDVEKFYDSVSWAKLFEWALDLLFPPNFYWSWPPSTPPPESSESGGCTPSPISPPTAWWQGASRQFG